MQKIKKNTNLLDVIEKFEECLDNDMSMYTKDTYDNLKYSIKKFKEYLSKRSPLSNRFEIYSMSFESYYERNIDDPYEVMLMSQLNDFFDSYLLQEDYKKLGIQEEKITKIVKNPETDIEDSDYQRNFFKTRDKYLLISLTESLNSNLIKCKVPENQSLVITLDKEDEKEIVFNEGEEFFVYGKRSSLTNNEKPRYMKLLNNNEDLKYQGIQCFMIMYDLKIVNKNNDLVKVINNQSSFEDLIRFNERYDVGFANAKIPLNWLKQKIMKFNFDNQDYYIPISIGFNNSDKEILLAKMNDNKNLELLIKLFNKKDLSDEEKKYILLKDLNLILEMKDLSEDIKKFVIEQKKFKNNEQVYKRLRLEQSEELDNMFFKEKVGLKYLKDINYEPSSKCIKQHIQRSGLELYYVDNPTPALCLKAVQVTGTALRFVKNQTLEICKTAVLRDPKAIKYVDEKFKKDINVNVETKRKPKI